MATIQCKRNVTNEYNFRRYEISSDADFETVKNTIKAAGGKFDGTDKVWWITGDAIKAIREAGYIATEKSPFFQDAFIEQNIKDGSETSTYIVGFKMMQQNSPRMSGNMTVTFDTSDTVVNAEVERINAIGTTQTKPSVATMAGQPAATTVSRFYGVRALARKAANEAAAKVEARTLELLKETKRTKEEYVEVLRQVVTEFGIR